MSSKTVARKTGARAKAEASGLDPAIVKALAHPLRMRVLSRLNEVVASPKELAEEFEVSLPMLSYHFRVLLDVGAIELVSETQVRGAIEHHYRATTRAFFSDRDWERLPVNSRQGISKTVIDQALADLTEAFAAGTFDSRPDRHLSFSQLVFDETGWEELRGVLSEALDRALEIQAESVGRLQDEQSGGPEVLTRLTVLLYEGAGARPAARSVSRKRRRK
jgi:DNA-binding transcriptional ArsR family regulator